MKKTIIKFGLVGGVLMIGLVFLIATLCEREIVTLDRAELFGYAGMLIALTMVFFGIRQYRQEHGSITFWKGCQIGLGRYPKFPAILRNFRKATLQFWQ